MVFLKGCGNEAFCKNSVVERKKNGLKIEKPGKNRYKRERKERCLVPGLRNTLFSFTALGSATVPVPPSISRQIRVVTLQGRHPGGAPCVRRPANSEFHGVFRLFSLNCSIDWGVGLGAAPSSVPNHKKNTKKDTCLTLVFFSSFLGMLRGNPEHLSLASSLGWNAGVAGRRDLD